MTPDDLRALADLDSRAGAPLGNALRAAADALEQAWAERDYERKANGYWVSIERDRLAGVEARADRAEAELSLALLAVEQQAAALARVRALCDELDATGIFSDRWYGDKIRAAIEGGAE